MAEPYPATVKLTDLPTGTTAGGTEIFMAVQTTAGVGNTVQLTLTQMLASASLSGAYYGTGTLTQYGVAYDANGSTQLGITAAGGTGVPLVGAGAAAPAFTTLGIPGGGLGTTVLGTFSLLMGSISSTVIGQIPAAATGLALVAQGALNSAIFTILGIAGGGFGTTALTQYGVLYGNGAGVPGVTPVTPAAGLPLVASATSPLFTTLPLAGLTQVGPGMALANGSTGTASVTATSIVTLGSATITGLLVLSGFTSGRVTLRPFGNAGTYDFILPVTAGLPNQFLKAQANATAAQTFEYPGWVLLNTITVSAVATVADITSFTTTFNDYIILIESLSPANTTGLRLTYQTGGSFASTSYLNAVGALTTSADLSGNSVHTTTGGGWNGRVTLYNVNSTNTFKHGTVEANFFTNATTLSTASSGGFTFNGGSASVTGFALQMVGGNLSSGKIKVFGVRAT